MESLIIFLVGVLTLAGFYAALSLVLNLIAGWAGMWDLGVAGLVSVSAYTYIILTQTQVPVGLILAPGFPIPVGVLASIVVTGITAFLVALPTVRLRGEFFLITTLAFAEVIRQVILNESSLTRGATGFSSVSRPFQDLVPAGSYSWVLFGLTALILAIVYFVTQRIAKTPYVRLLRAARDNEAVAQSLGKRIVRLRMITYTFAGCLIGLIAPLYVWHMRSVAPTMFVSEMTFVVWTALVIGGIGSRSGPILGATVLIVCTEMLTFLQGSAEYAQILAATRPLILGVLLILVLRLRPSGLLSERSQFKFSAVNLSGRGSARSVKEAGAS